MSDDLVVTLLGTCSPRPSGTRSIRLEGSEIDEGHPVWEQDGVRIAAIRVERPEL